MSRASMLPELGVGFGGNAVSGGEDLGLLLREQWRVRDGGDREELNLYRSGSAPTAVEGSRVAAGGLSDRRSGAGLPPEKEPDPPYLAFFNALANAKPYEPQRYQAGSSAVRGAMDIRGLVGDESGESLFSMQPRFNERRDGSEAQSRRSPDLLDGERDVLIGYRDSADGERSLTDIFQDELGRGAPLLGFPSRQATWNVSNDFIEPLDSLNNQLALQQEMASVDEFGHGRNVQSAAGLQHNSLLASQNFASVPASSITRSVARDYHLMERAPSSRLWRFGAMSGAADMGMNSGSCSFNGVSPGMVEPDDLVDALSGMRLSREGVLHGTDFASSRLQQEFHHDLFQDCHDSKQTDHHIKKHPLWRSSEQGHLGASSVPHSTMSLYPHYVKGVGGKMDIRKVTSRPDALVELHKRSFSPSSSRPKAPFAASISNSGCLSHHFDNAVPGSAMASPSMDPRPTTAGFFAGPSLARAADLQNLSRMESSAAAGAQQMPFADQHYIQYPREPEFATQVSRGNPSKGNPYMNSHDKAYSDPVLPPQRLYGMPFLGNSVCLHHNYHETPPFGLHVPYPGSPLASSNLPSSPAGPGSPLGLGERNMRFCCSHLPPSPAGPSSPLAHGERSMRFPSGLGLSGGGLVSWHSDSPGMVDEGFPPSLLEELKANKTRSSELSEIAGHVVEFSSDQYGSRFIQQKLETATAGEKNMVFEEIRPHALSLMTDVFGNYVVQKFFEHGTATQIRELANQVYGHVLALSLQMYGCRVIQKAIEVVDFDQRTKMAAELDGHVMRCIRDQNGNHVIQKCIESIPQDAIKFIISSFLDQVVTLSTHPYGCRVIQRVLEHCDDPRTQQIVMDEIMQCVCMLAQDQYGNYVIQHVLEHGKPHERSAIIKQLAGQIVQMSQQKFASNVVEKCLVFGGPQERQILVNEMLGTTDENEPLQAMMKDQFGNYVVQKVLETVNDQQRELILSRIKVHLNTLKKYTYGKHIVVRVEKLVAAGECMTNIADRVVSDLSFIIDS